MSEENKPVTPATTPPEGVKYGRGGNARPPGAGRAPGTPNKKTVSIEAILQKRAELKGKPVDEVSAIYTLYLVMDRNCKELGLKEGEITTEQALDAAKHLSQFEAPKKRAVEVTGAQLTGGAFVVSSGEARPEGQTTEQWAEQARTETEALEKENLQKRLAELEGKDKKEPEQ